MTGSGLPLMTGSGLPLMTGSGHDDRLRASWHVAWVGLWLNRGIGGVSGSRLCGWRETLPGTVGGVRHWGSGLQLYCQWMGQRTLSSCCVGRPAGGRVRPGLEDRNDQDTTTARTAGETNDHETTGERVSTRKRLVLERRENDQ